MGVLDRLAKWVAVRSYRKRLGRLFVQRHGRERHYTPPQVLTTIKVNGLSERFAPYACAMFCSKQSYSEFVEKQVQHAASSVDPLRESSVPLWIGLAQHWPTHHEVVAEFGHAHWDHGAHAGPSHVGDHPADLGDHGDASHGSGGDGSH